MKGLMYFIAIVFAIMGAMVALLGLSYISAIAGFLGAGTFGLIGYISEA